MSRYANLNEIGEVFILLGSEKSARTEEASSGYCHSPAKLF